MACLDSAHFLDQALLLKRLERRPEHFRDTRCHRERACLATVNDIGLDTNEELVSHKPRRRWLRIASFLELLRKPFDPFGEHLELLQPFVIVVSPGR